MMRLENQPSHALSINIKYRKTPYQNNTFTGQKKYIQLYHLTMYRIVQSSLCQEIRVLWSQRRLREWLRTWVLQLHSSGPDPSTIQCPAVLDVLVQILTPRAAALQASVPSLGPDSFFLTCCMVRGISQLLTRD